MAHYVTSVATALSPAEAFAFMADVTRFAEWDPGVRKAVRVAGDGTTVGSAYELTVSAGGTTTMRYEVTEYEAPRRVLLVARTAYLTSVDEVRVRATPTGSIVSYDATLTLNGRWALLDPLLGLAFGTLGDRAAEGLRRALKGTVVAA